MAGRGNTIPKDPATRVRQNKPAPRTKVSTDNRLRGPVLPVDAFTDEESWHPRTLAFWSALRRSPQARTFIETDWELLIGVALMHHTMWAKGRWEFASEVRLSLAKFGLTPADRKVLGIEIETPASSPQRSAKVTDISSRRARLSG